MDVYIYIHTQYCLIVIRLKNILIINLSTVRFCQPQMSWFFLITIIQLDWLLPLVISFGLLTHLC